MLGEFQTNLLNAYLFNLIKYENKSMLFMALCVCVCVCVYACTCTVLGFELRVYTLSHSASPFLGWVFLR
jgi:ABC-type uncharacterized transport system permease subunit